MSILAQIIGLACLLFWGFWLCCKLRLPAGFAPLCGLCFCMVVLQLAGSCNQLWLGAQLRLVGAVLTLAQRRRHEILPQLLFPGVLAFCSAAGVLMAVFAIRQPEFQTWDEFSHWGIYFKSVFYQHRFAVWDTTRSLAHQAYPQGLPGLYALFALPAAQYREADVLFVTALPLAAAASALFALPQVTARRPRIAYTVCACLAAPALFWLFAPDTPYTTAYMDAPVGALFAAALCVILLPCAANSRVQRGLALAFLCEAYDEEHLTDSKGKEDIRTVLHLHPALAPYKCAVLPLSKKLGEKAMEIRNELSKYFMVDYDDTGSIGKRYRREDEIGTPYCITVDFDTVGDEAKGIAADNCVTVRNRDTMEQVRMPISELKSYIESKIEF